MADLTNTPEILELVPTGPGGPGGWSCHTFEDGETFPSLCLADDCPTARKKEQSERHGDVIGA